jgi:hypothetical protein
LASFKKSTAFVLLASHVKTPIAFSVVRVPLQPVRENRFALSYSSPFHRITASPGLSILWFVSPIPIPTTEGEENTSLTVGILFSLER